MISIFDVSGDGIISESEFTEALKILGISIFNERYKH
jgi:Ca2+-binding EF-hand superfamily protein